MQKKRILICGAGSIGVYLGTMLYNSGHEVKLFGRKKLREVGDCIKINGKIHKVPEKLFRMPKNHETDVIFITTKLYDFEPMLFLIKNRHVKYSSIAAIQNGLLDLAKYKHTLGKNILPIVVFSGFNLSKGNLAVKPTKTGWIVENSSSGRKISALLRSTGISCNPKKNFHSLRAEKIIINCCLNALSAIENKPFRDLFKKTKIRERIHNLFVETYNIVRKKYALRNRKNIKKDIIQNWANLAHYSSTHQDIKSKGKHEIPFLNGYVVKLGKKYGLPTENNQRIIADMNKIARKI